MASNKVGEVAAWGALSVKSASVPPPKVVNCIPLSFNTVQLSWTPAETPLNILAYTIHYILLGNYIFFNQFIRNDDNN